MKQLPLPSVRDAVEFRRDQFGLSQAEWAKIICMAPSHYSEFANGKRPLPRKAMAKAFEFGVPAECLFQCRPVNYIIATKGKP